MIDFWHDCITCKNGNFYSFSEQIFLFHSLEVIFFVIELLAKLSIRVYLFHNKDQVFWTFRDDSFDRHFHHYNILEDAFDNDSPLGFIWQQI